MTNFSYRKPRLVGFVPILSSTSLLIATLATLDQKAYAMPSQALVKTSLVSCQMRNGLPPTVMDSFVYEAKEHAEHIYGDEGINGPPPYELFTEPHRINTGILDRRDQGLTTGHGSWMPDAVGRDEFLGLESSQSGARGVSEADGFYAGGTYVVPGVATRPDQVAGGTMTLDWLGGQIDETRWQQPLPLDWNAQGNNWVPAGNGSWVNKDTGVVMSPNGSSRYTRNVVFGDGTIEHRAGDVVGRAGNSVSGF